MKRQVCFPFVLYFPYFFPYVLVQNCDDLRTHQTAVRTIRRRRAFLIGCSTNIHTSPNLTGSPARSTLRAESAENKLAFTNNSLTERTRSRLGHVVPVHILN